MKPMKLCLRPLPEGAGLSKFGKSRDHFLDIFSTMGNPITVQAPSKIDTRKEFDEVLKFKDAL